VLEHNSRSAGQRAGLQQIAEELGISMMTVSRALNGRGDEAELEYLHRLLDQVLARNRGVDLSVAECADVDSGGIFYPVAGRLVEPLHDVDAEMGRARSGDAALRDGVSPCGWGRRE
jgi:transcriptional regulator with XRE-family HTH domain